MQITPQVPGTIVAIEADDTETVSAGQPLVRLDSADTDVALQQAQAKLAQTVRQVRTYYVQNDALAADVDLRSADIVRAQAELARAQSDVSRRQQLAKSGGVSGEEILHAEAALKSAQSGLAQAKAALAAARAKLATNQALTRGTDVAGHPDVQQAVAGLRNAWLAQSRTVLPAPVAWCAPQRPGRPACRPGRRADDRGAAGSGVGGSQLRKASCARCASASRQDECRPVRHLGDLPRHDRRPGCRHRQRLRAAARTERHGQLDQGGAARARAHHARSRGPEEAPLRVGLSMEVEVDVGKQDGEPLTQAERKEPAWSTRAFEPAHGEIDAMVAKIIRDNLDTSDAVASAASAGPAR